MNTAMIFYTLVGILVNSFSGDPEEVSVTRRIQGKEVCEELSRTFLRDFHADKKNAGKEVYFVCIPRSTKV